MTRSELIHAVKEKIDEITPFDDPADCIALDGENDSQKVVKPITETIDMELDAAASFCLSTLPLHLLAEDTDSEDFSMGVDRNGVGHLLNITENYRLIRLECSVLFRPILSFITSSSPTYALQLNKYTRGGLSKPVGAFVPETGEIEVYSFQSALFGKSVPVKLMYIDCNVAADEVMSPVEQFIILRTAISVMRIQGDANAVQLLSAQYEEAVTSKTN